MNKSINIFNKKEVNFFKKEFKKAIKNDKKIFMFKGQKILTDYAKYLIKHINNILGKNND